MSWVESTFPIVSIIVVNLNGEDLLADCLDALLNQHYPSNRLEIILVDNGSTDESVSFVKANYPQVRVIEAGRNLGFAGGNNLGAKEARGKYIAFINNDSVAHPDWLQTIVRVLEAQTEYACAAAKVLSKDGTKIDFVGPVLNIYGRAFQLYEGFPADSMKVEEPYEILAPCGNGMVIHREIFLDVGGFDEDYIAYYEDVDLGWRLWLFGYKVIFVPQAIVYHRKHQTGKSFPVEQRYVLSELNALRTIIKNYEEHNLWHVLPLSLLLAVKRSLEQAGLDRSQYLWGSPCVGDPQQGVFAPEPAMNRVAVSYIVAMEQIAEEMPQLMAKRESIQRRRIRSDEEIFSLFPLRPDNPLFPWREYNVIQANLVKALRVPKALSPRYGSHLLIITHELIGPKMAGPGIRAWEMACALADHLEVTLAAPNNPSRIHPNLRVIGYDPDDLDSLTPFIESADVILATGQIYVRIPSLQNLAKPAIVDLYDPFELEKLTLSHNLSPQQRTSLDTDTLIDLFLESNVGDFFICASERQRDFWLGVLLATGRVNTATYAQDPSLRNLIEVVPFGMPTNPPRKTQDVLKGVVPGIDREDKVILWNGGIWEWLDPLTLIDALAEVLKIRRDVKLVFAAAHHFDAEVVPEMPVLAELLSRCRDYNLIDKYVFFLDWIPYDERGEYLLEADIGISLHKDTIESRFAFRSRLVDCIWAGLPVITTEGDVLAEIVSQYHLGFVVPAGNPSAVARAILDALAQADLRERVFQNSRDIVKSLSWNKVVQPIIRFVERATFAPDALEAARNANRAVYIRNLEARVRDQQAYIGNLEARVRDQQAYIEAIQRGRIMRLMRKINSWLGRKK